MRMATAIYYFSGTGNSLAAARELASKLGAALIPLAPLAEKETVVTDAEAIGIVFPVYFGDIPGVVGKFASKLTGIEGKYIFAVSTFGGASGLSLKSLGKILHLRGGALAAGFGLHMPQNAFLKPWEKQEKVFSACIKRLDKIAKSIAGRERGIFPANALLELMIKPLHLMFKPMYRKSFLKLSGGSTEQSDTELIAMTDRSYRADEKCNGCGICAKACPVNNIRLEGGKPVWQHRCEACLACYNWCPNGAITGGVAAKGYHYRHPQVKSTDITRSARSL